MKASFICWKNYLETDLLNSTTVSSEDASFPYLNLLDKYRRSKKWRSAGAWAVDSSNNVLVFRETTGVDLTATVAAANYSSSTSFCAAIKTALQAVGASTYTVTIDSTTKKLKIQSNGSGGGGLFQIKSTNVSSAGFCNLVGFSTSVDKTGALIYSADNLKISSGEWFKWDLGAPGNPRAFILTASGTSLIQFSPNATITLQANATDVWTSPQFSMNLNWDQKQIVAFDKDGLGGGAGFRFWRLLINDVANVDGYIEANHVYLGEAWAPDRGAIQFPFNEEIVDRTQVATSESGMIFSEIRPKSSKFSLEYDALNYQEKEMIEAIFDKFGKGRPCFWVFDSNAAFSSASNYYARYCFFDREPSWSLTTVNFFSMKIDLKEGF